MAHRMTSKLMFLKIPLQDQDLADDSELLLQAQGVETDPVITRNLVAQISILNVILNYSNTTFKN